MYLYGYVYVHVHLHVYVHVCVSVCVCLLVDVRVQKRLFMCELSHADSWRRGRENRKAVPRVGMTGMPARSSAAGVGVAGVGVTRRPPDTSAASLRAGGRAGAGLGRAQTLDTHISFGMCIDSASTSQLAHKAI